MDTWQRTFGSLTKTMFLDQMVLTMDDFVLPLTLEPFLEDKDFKNDLTTDGIVLW